MPLSTGAMKACEEPFKDTNGTKGVTTLDWVEYVRVRHDFVTSTRKNGALDECWTGKRDTHNAHVKCSSSWASMAWDIIENAVSSFLDRDNIRSCISPVMRVHSRSLLKSVFSRSRSSSRVIRCSAGSIALPIFAGGELSLSHEETAFLRRLGRESSVGTTSCLS